MPIPEIAARPIDANSNEGDAAMTRFGFVGVVSDRDGLGEEAESATPFAETVAPA